MTSGGLKLMFTAGELTSVRWASCMFSLCPNAWLCLLMGHISFWSAHLSLHFSPGAPLALTASSLHPYRPNNFSGRPACGQTGPLGGSRSPSLGPATSLTLQAPAVQKATYQCSPLVRPLAPLGSMLQAQLHFKITQLPIRLAQLPPWLVQKCRW